MSPSSLRALRGTAAAWTLAFVARALLGCDAEAHADPSTTPPGTGAPVQAPKPVEVASAPIPSAHAPGPSGDADVLTLSAVGDCTLGDPAGADRAPGSFHRTFDEAGADLGRPFSGVASVLGADDLTIANLEGTLTTQGCRKDVVFAFKGRPEFTGMLTKGSVELVNLANNHTADCGFRGMAETKQNLDTAGVGWFGLGKVDTRTVKGIEVKNLGYTGGRLEVREEVVADVKANKRPDNLLVVSFHWGIEGEHAVNTVQQKLAHAAIDAGADLVLGHHPHVLQGIETYRGKTIVYSLGNFVFGGNAQPGEVESMIFQARFAKKDGAVVMLGHDLVPVQISANPKQNDFRPILLEGAEAQKVRDNVAAYSKLVPSG